MFYKILLEFIHVVFIIIIYIKLNYYSFLFY